MEEKKGSQVKYTPPRDKTIPESLKKDKPISSAAEAQEDIEKNLPESTRKSSGSEKSLSKIQDELEDKKITPAEALKKAGIKETSDIPPPKKDVKPKSETKKEPTEVEKKEAEIAKERSVARVKEEAIVAKAKEDAEAKAELEEKEKKEAEKVAKVKKNTEEAEALKKKVAEAKAKADKEKEATPKVKKKFKKITLEDGHTYHSDEEDVVCSNCLLPRNKTTTQCFKQPQSRVGLRKFNDGLIDFKDGMWISLEQD